MDTIWIWRSGERVEAVHNGHNKITSGFNRYKDIIRSGVGLKMQRKDYQHSTIDRSILLPHLLDAVFQTK